MKKRAFTETMQIGIVVRNLDATVKRYEDDYGIGPWNYREMDLGESEDFREFNKPSRSKTRIAVTMIGSVMWELIQPLDEESMFARFLAEKGEGVHHVAVRSNYDEVLATQSLDNLPLRCEVDGIKVSYLPTDKTLGVLLEVFDGF